MGAVEKKMYLIYQIPEERGNSVVQVTATLTEKDYVTISAFVSVYNLTEGNTVKPHIEFYPHYIPFDKDEFIQEAARDIASSFSIEAEEAKRLAEGAWDILRGRGVMFWIDEKTKKVEATVRNIL